MTVATKAPGGVTEADLQTLMGLRKIFALHVLFVVFGANQGNEFASFVYTAAQVFVLGLGDVFTPDDALLGVVLNYGLAALVYAIVGQLVVKALQRR